MITERIKFFACFYD